MNTQQIIIYILILLVVVFLYKKRKGDDDKPSNRTKLSQMPSYNYDFKWALKRINKHKKYADDLNKHVDVIEYIDEYFKLRDKQGNITGQSEITVAQAIPRKIQFLIPCWTWIQKVPHKGKRICSTIGHELAHHATGIRDGHDKEMDDYYREFCKVVGVPYEPYRK